MTDQPGATPMGVGVESRAAAGLAVLRDGVVACSVHSDGVITSSGSLYRCDYNHLLRPPQALNAERAGGVAHESP